MSKFNYPCGRTLPELFDYFHIKLCDGDYIARTLISEGYTTLGICYGAAKSDINCFVLQETHGCQIFLLTKYEKIHLSQMIHVGKYNTLF